MKNVEDMSLEELDAFCDKIGLTNEDWDEGGGYIPKAVIRVVLQERQEVVNFLHTPCEHFSPSRFYTKSPCLGCWKKQLKKWGISEPD